MNEIPINAITQYFQSLQSKITEALEEADGLATFKDDKWSNANGKGNSKIMKEGSIFEQCGIGFSYIQGNNLPSSASSRNPNLSGSNFIATGVSLVLHPKNPYIPTTHANFRFFTTNETEAKPIWWFGGGYDLTPYYPFLSDVIHWHKTARAACDQFNKNLYPKYKKWCDDYFYLPHRNETRGVGGIFFDDLNEMGFEKSFAFIKSIGDSFLPAYLPIVNKRSKTNFSERERSFQLYRRGRYVEFNLLHDRGTLFGLQSKGRTESILMSLPPKVRWEYNWSPKPNSQEAELYNNFLKPQSWLD